MVEIELTRIEGGRRLYGLDGIGTLRLQGLFARAATAEADGSTWRFATRGVLSQRAVATDETGAVVGDFEPRKVRRGGALRWDGRELALRPASSWRERYALADGERELAVFDGKGWGRRPVKVTVDDPGALEAGLMLFVAFVVRGLAEETGSSAAISSTAATSG